MMKRIVVAGGLVVGLIGANSARADTTSATIEADGGLLHLSSVVAGSLQGEGRLQLSDMLIGVLSSVNSRLEGVAPDGRIEVNDEGLPSAAVTPLKRVTGVLDTSSGVLAAQQAVLGDGFTIFKPGVPSSRKGREDTPAGQLTLSDITVDLGTKAIYANLWGGNGVGPMQGVHMWDFETLTGSTDIVLSPCPLSGQPCPPSILKGFELSGLTITTSAFDLMLVSLGLTSMAKLNLLGVTDYGTLTISPVPESSTLVLMSMGLLGLAICNSIQRRS